MEVIAGTIFFDGLRVSGGAVSTVAWNIALWRIAYFDIMLVIVSAVFAAARIIFGCFLGIHSITS